MQLVVVELLQVNQMPDSSQLLKEHAGLIIFYELENKVQEDMIILMGIWEIIINKIKKGKKWLFYLNI
jgi:hypothetical protein